jgi:ribosomal protein L12E/L44/L45/RPP1/RPP2
VNDSAVAPATDNASILERVIIAGDLSRLAPADRVQYYQAVCDSVGLNPLTKPFDYLSLNGKLVLYATKTATDQLRSIKGISIDGAERDLSDPDYATWLVTGHDAAGRVDTEIGTVTIGGLRGEAKANAIMKALTKGKRRLTLSLAGLGWLDETEVGSIPASQAAEVDMVTGEVKALPPRSLDERIAERAERVTTSAASPVPAGQRQDEAEQSAESATSPALGADSRGAGDVVIEEQPLAPRIQCDSVETNLGDPEQCRREAGHKGAHRTPNRSW